MHSCWPIRALQVVLKYQMAINGNHTKVEVVLATSLPSASPHSSEVDWFFCFVDAGDLSSNALLPSPSETFDR